MRRMRVAIIGAGTLTEHAILPVLSGPDGIAPPDNGAWWSRRVSSHIDIAYQPPARPEIVALCDSDATRLERVGQMARIAARFADWEADVGCSAGRCLDLRSAARAHRCVAV